MQKIKINLNAKFTKLNEFMIIYKPLKQMKNQEKLKNLQIILKLSRNLVKIFEISKTAKIKAN